jgi:mannose-6-phosphate isomerase-like protein (cupin superfamily)
MSNYTVCKIEEVPDFFGGAYPGEMRLMAGALGAEQVAFTWRRMPPGTGGRGSYGHRHPGQEEIYLVASGKATFKVGDDVFEAGPKTAVRMTSDEHYSVHNDTDAEAQLLIFSTRLADAPFDKQDGFWPVPS